MRNDGAGMIVDGIDTGEDDAVSASTEMMDDGELQSVLRAEFDDARDKILMGAERRTLMMTEDDKRLTAFHEGGHAVVQRVLPKCDPVQKVTIVSRGMALGYTMAIPAEDRYLQSKTEFEDKIAGLLGGNAAERLIFGDTTTGASNDIEKATALARRMVTEFGMSDRLGPLASVHRVARQVYQFDRTRVWLEPWVTHAFTPPVDSSIPRPSTPFSCTR